MKAVAILLFLSIGAANSNLSGYAGKIAVIVSIVGISIALGLFIIKYKNKDNNE